MQLQQQNHNKQYCKPYDESSGCRMHSIILLKSVSKLPESIDLMVEKS